MAAVSKVWIFIRVYGGLEGLEFQILDYEYEYKVRIGWYGNSIGSKPAGNSRVGRTGESLFTLEGVAHVIWATANTPPPACVI